MSTPDNQQPNPGCEWYHPTTISEPTCDQQQQSGRFEQLQLKLYQDQREELSCDLDKSGRQNCKFELKLRLGSKIEIQVCKASGVDGPIHLTRASKARATTHGSRPSRSDKGKQHALYDEDDEIEEDIGVLDCEGDGPMLGDIDMIDLDYY
ncbi:hypothetical protein E3N88_23421 [Mikania micrantha]|uniref:Uncharacterized protein n=1 Tax=Mikania micrantha TaxID=192012 RepID=A0A5N6NEX6_9ASTR|nr:hypothetical protein E3N88_23421 [Mikania micrantha]